MGEHLDYDNLRADTVRQVAKLMAAAAITAPKSSGQHACDADPFAKGYGERTLAHVSGRGTNNEATCRRRNRQPVRSSGGRVEATTGLEWAA